MCVSNNNTIISKIRNPLALEATKPSPPDTSNPPLASIAPTNLEDLIHLRHQVTVTI